MSITIPAFGNVVSMHPDAPFLAKPGDPFSPKYSQGTLVIFYQPLGSFSASFGGFTFVVEGYGKPTEPDRPRASISVSYSDVGPTAVDIYTQASVGLSTQLPTSTLTTNIQTNSTWYAVATAGDMMAGDTKSWRYSNLSNGVGTVYKRDLGTKTYVPDFNSVPYTGVYADDDAYVGFKSNLGLYRIAEIAYWDVVKTEAEIRAFAAEGFASINQPENLVFDWNFMKDWRLADPLVIPDDSGNGNHGVIGASISDSYLPDAPVPVFLITEAESEFDSHNFSIFSTIVGTVALSAYPLGTPEPSAADVYNGVGAIQTAQFVHDATGLNVGGISGLETGTEYLVYAVQDESGSGDYSRVVSIVSKTPTKYSEIITDVTGAEVTGQSGIQWAWFDEENPSTLTTAVTQGVAELTDATGLLEITLPTSISTPKGSKGTMVLRADWGGSTQTASHLVEVK